MPVVNTAVTLRFFYRSDRHPFHFIAMRSPPVLVALLDLPAVGHEARHQTTVVVNSSELLVPLVFIA
jgi:hypothetical protein